MVLAVYKLIWEVLLLLTVVVLVYSRQLCPKGLPSSATYLVCDSSQYPPWSKPSEILASFCNLSIVFTHRCDYFQISILSCQRNSEWCGDLHPWPILWVEINSEGAFFFPCVPIYLSYLHHVYFKLTFWRPKTFKLVYGVFI